MCQTQEAPRSETLRKRELQGHLSLLVCGQLGIEEGCLVEILTKLYIVCPFFLYRRH